MSRVHALQACPRVSEVSLDYNRYGEEIEELCLAAAAYSPRVEPIDYDQVFLSLAANDEPLTIFSCLAQTLSPLCSHRLSAGFASNKLMAKAATLAVCSGYLNGITKAAYLQNSFVTGGRRRCRFIEVRAGYEREFLSPLPFSSLWMMDERTAKKFERLGFHTVGDLAGMPVSTLVGYLGPEGYLVHEFSHGRCSVPVRALFPPSSRVVEKKLDGEGPDSIMLLLPDLARRLTDVLAASADRVQRLVVEIEGELKAPLRASHIFPRPSSSYGQTLSALRSICRSLLEEKDQAARTRSFCLLRVTASGPRTNNIQQASLFGKAKGQWETSSSLLEELIDNVQRRFSAGALFWGADIPRSRRERLLSYWDPYRRN